MSLWGIIMAVMFLAKIPTGVLADRLGRKLAINRATVMSVIGMLGGLYQALMGLRIGWVADASLSRALIVCGAAMLLGSLLFWQDES